MSVAPTAKSDAGKASAHAGIIFDTNGVGAGSAIAAGVASCGAGYFVAAVVIAIYVVVVDG